MLEKQLLQLAVALACIVPISAGLTGVFEGAAFLGGGSVDMDSHMRYLSGLLFGIGLGFLGSIREIERYGERFKLLTGIVVAGGVARFLGLTYGHVPGVAMKTALVMELAVTPALCLWQHRIARRYRSSITCVD